MKIAFFSLPDSPSTAYSDSDSEWSSLERQRMVADALSKVNNKKSSSHKRSRKKRTAIPVATPKVPTLGGMPGGGMVDGIVGLNYSVKDDKSWRMDSTEKGEFFVL